MSRKRRGEITQGMYKKHERSTKTNCETSDKEVKSRLIILMSLDDRLAAIAYNMKYHLACLVKYKRNIEKSCDENVIELNKAQMVSDLEIIDVINRT